MKTDKELLQLAAKAAGYEIYSWADNIVRTDRRDKMWNPLTDDGDALRLAVDLCIGVHIEGEAESEAVWANEVMIYTDGNKHAATRRAIVSAAAAIGEGVE